MEFMSVEVQHPTSIEFARRRTCRPAGVGSDQVPIGNQCEEGKKQSARDRAEELALQNFTEATRGSKCPERASPRATIVTQGDVP
jgi:hypothetical protein